MHSNMNFSRSEFLTTNGVGFLIMDSCFKAHYGMGIHMNHAKKNYLRIELARLRVFLLFTFHAVHRLFPESFHDSYEAHMRWRP